MMIFDKLKGFNIILASDSPRRRQLLEQSGISFTLTSVDCDEKFPDNLKNSSIAEYLAIAKSEAFSGELKKNDILITADTIVWCKETLLGKPSGYDEAFKFLRMLSGCEHEVITAISLKSLSGSDVFSVTTSVTFRELEDEEINYYINNFKPFDKAGAYGIQEWIGLTGITSISGSYYNVVGMPASDLLLHLVQFVEKY
jgi:septum formation protein